MIRRVRLSPDSRGPTSGRSSRGSRSTAFNYDSGVQSTRLSAREELRRSESREGTDGLSVDMTGKRRPSYSSVSYRGTGAAVSLLAVSKWVDYLLNVLCVCGCVRGCDCVCGCVRVTVCVTV